MVLWIGSESYRPVRGANVPISMVTLPDIFTSQARTFVMLGAKLALATG
jgi:hypothetical protein